MKLKAQLGMGQTDGLFAQATGGEHVKTGRLQDAELDWIRTDGMRDKLLTDSLLSLSLVAESWW